MRSSTEDHGRREGALSGTSSETETNHERLVTLGNTLGVARGEVGGWGYWRRGITEGT